MTCPSPSGPDAIGIIELELLKLVRHLETFGRRGSLYVSVDRAGYLAMRMLESLGPVSAHCLAQALRLDASTVTRQISALVSEGLAVRKANPADGRSTTIVLTDEGRAAMRELECRRRLLIEELVRGWDEPGQISLGTSLARLNDSLLRTVTERRPADRPAGHQATEPGAA
ncbi:MAG TPA: MarR family transcriptional regulator [Streptosporangiaceae bacterium]|nr:MarR family transcriptional regulator [Streptosporangiaceae bacterium]